MMQLKDPTLLRQQCYVNGQWCDADSGETCAVTNPATGETDRHRAEDGRGRNPPRDRRGRCRLARLARQDRQGAQRRAAQVERPDARQRRRPGADHDGRAGQAAGRGEGRNRLRGVVHRVVRRRGQARLRRHDAVALGRPAHRRHQAADRRLRGDHAVELPGRDDHAQGRPGARRRLPDGLQAGAGHALLGARAGRARRARRRAGRRLQRPDRIVGRDRRRDDRPTRPCASSPSPARPRSAAC